MYAAAKYRLHAVHCVAIQDNYKALAHALHVRIDRLPQDKENQ